MTLQPTIPPLVVNELKGEAKKTNLLASDLRDGTPVATIEGTTPNRVANELGVKVVNDSVNERKSLISKGELKG